MTGPEKLDFAALRDEMREGFRDVTNELRALGQRVGSLETTRSEQAAVLAERERAREARLQKRISRSQWVGGAAALLGAAYGAIRLITDLHLL